MSKYKNTKNKVRKLWKKTKKNEVDVNKVEKLNIKSRSVSNFGDIYTISSELKNFQDEKAYPLATYIDKLYTFELDTGTETLPERFLPFISTKLILETIEVWEEKFEDYSPSTTYNTTIRRETIGSTIKTYLDCYVYISSWYWATKPFYFKVLITLNYPNKYHEIRTNKK